LTFVDSGGHYTQQVYESCRERFLKRVFPIKGRGGDGIPFVMPPKKIPIRDNKLITCWLYNIGVNAGKAGIMSSIKVQEPGPKYCHFPLNTDRGYDTTYFNGLLSEKPVLKTSNGTQRFVWEKLPGHARNEALDCRNYAMAAFAVLSPNMELIEKQLRGEVINKVKDKKKRGQRKAEQINDDW